jgi:hypothetical protein
MGSVKDGRGISRQEKSMIEFDCTKGRHVPSIRCANCGHEIRDAGTAAAQAVSQLLCNSFSVNKDVSHF